MKTISELVKGYKNYLERTNYSSETIDVYTNNAKKFLSKRGKSKLSKEDLSQLKIDVEQANYYGGSHTFTSYLVTSIKGAYPGHRQIRIIPLNQILYGPPGTGKTYFLNEMKEEFTDREAILDKYEVIKNIADGNPWWKLLAALLYINESMKVPDLVADPILLAKHNPDKPKANQIIWSQLQLHTKRENKHVNHERRHDPLIFDKDDSSNWVVDKKIIENELTDVLEIVEEIKSIDSQSGNTKEDRRYQFITFHQSFSYEDFVEGIKPVLRLEEDAEAKPDELSYQIEKGIFYKACLEALKLAGYGSFTECFQDSKETRKNRFEKAKAYALFIDEISRGNVSSIFGELITLIEKDKRLGEDQEIWVSLPYDKSIKFGVPPNLYIVGTMNTADRSVEALDTALRRRFAFQKIGPKPALLQPHFMLWRLWQKDWDYKWEDEKWIKHEKSLLKLLDGEIINNDKYRALEESDIEEGLSKNVFEGVVEFKGLDLSNLLATVNSRIELLIDQDHMIGHSYFFSLIGAEDCKTELLSIFYNKVIPLLEEYFYGNYGKIGLVLGKNFVHTHTGNEVHFAEFDLEDKAIFQEKDLYTIEDYRIEKPGRMDFLEAVKTIYESPK